MKPNDHHSYIDKVAQHASRSRKQLQERFPHVAKRLADLEFDIKDIRRHSAHALSAAAVAGGVLLISPAIQHVVRPPQKEQGLSTEQINQILKIDLAVLLPRNVQPLPPEIEESVHTVVKQTLGINAVATLDGNHLNTTYGRIGGEQHMPRYPGDTIADHNALQVKGITAHRGAFGYFAPSEQAMTDEAVMQEKYYVAVQTMYLPNWKQRAKTLKEWYKFRRVLVINPTTGKSVVAVIGDAGPAAWTGKHFGGSPEIMEYLQPYKDHNDGKVVMLFIDDEQKSLALGPVREPVTAFIAKR